MGPQVQLLRVGVDQRGGEADGLQPRHGQQGRARQGRRLRGLRVRAGVHRPAPAPWSLDLRTREISSRLLKVRGGSFDFYHQTDIQAIRRD